MAICTNEDMHYHTSSAWTHKKQTMHSVEVQKLTTAQGPKKNNTLGYPVMKKGKKRKKRRMRKSKELGSKDSWKENALNAIKQKKGLVGQSQ